ncbi:MAG: hypothetical protein GWO20_20700 [Candidatus Korarchaeota archaeon]|nr:hypothetical protein [Candidatus Korarchaeota archaeon]NIU85644.1 hypothetical protein [Candidatus Thorarchaeota archaeon]NIW12956.1 hypothetical protein [Candidatus Thorarchaeota archaeon]NIW51101.1 hypothetical protein [Candidatus Korarchaeota archaeon]
MPEKGHLLKSLVVFYSRTGTTKNVGKAIAESLNSDIEAIVDMKKRSGVLGWIRAGKDAKKLTNIKEVTKDPAQYEVVVLGSPTWNNTFVPAIRTYINQYKDRFKKVACFCTQDGKETDTLTDMEAFCGQKPLATLSLRRKQEVQSGNYQERVRQFVTRICERAG